MKYKNLPAIIMLSAGAVTSIICIINKFSFLNTLKVILVVLLIFYVIGLIANRFISRINKDALESYVNKRREEMKEEASEEGIDEVTVTDEESLASKEEIGETGEEEK